MQDVLQKCPGGSYQTSDLVWPYKRQPSWQRNTFPPSAATSEHASIGREGSNSKRGLKGAFLQMQAFKEPAEKSQLENLLK